MQVRILYLWLLLVLVLLPACGATAQPVAQQGPPSVSFKEPESGAVYQVGDTITIRFSARDVNGVSQIELLANGKPIKVEPVEPAVNVFSGQHNWLPDTQGSYILELRAFNVNGEVSEPAQLFLNVEQGESVAAQPTPTDEPTATATLVMSEATPTEVPPTETPTVTPEVVSSGGANAPKLTVVAEAIFVRAGPNTTYPDVGKMSQGDVAIITAKDVSGAWWEIPYPPGSSLRGWVSSDAEFTVASGDLNTVAVAPAPPLDNGAVAQATVTSEPIDEATATPAPTNPDLPTISMFEADNTIVVNGQPVLLKWDLFDAKEAYLRYNNVDEGVMAPGQKTVFPSEDTRYTLIARNDSGEITRELFVQVDTNAAPLLGAPAIYRFSSDRFEMDDDEDEANLSWELANAAEAYLQYDGKEKGVVSPGQRLVSPGDDGLEYTLVTRNSYGETRSTLHLTKGSGPAKNSSTPSINSFTTDRVEISNGEAVILRWDVANAKEVFLRYDDQNQGVASPGERTVTPNRETRYSLVARNDTGETIAELLIRVR